MNPWILLDLEPTLDRSVIKQAYDEKSVAARESQSLADFSQLTAAYAQALAELKIFESELAASGQSQSLARAAAAYQAGQASPIEPESLRFPEEEPAVDQVDPADQQASSSASNPEPAPAQTSSSGQQPLRPFADKREDSAPSDQSGNSDAHGQSGDSDSTERGGQDLDPGLGSPFPSSSYQEPLTSSLDPGVSPYLAGKKEKSYDPLQPQMTYQLKPRKKGKFWRRFGISLFLIAGVLRMMAYHEKVQRQNNQNQTLTQLQTDIDLYKELNQYKTYDFPDALKTIESISQFQLEDAGDGTQTLKEGDRVIQTGIIFAAKLQGGRIYYETNQGVKAISGSDGVLPDGQEVLAAYPAWIKDQASDKPNAVVAQRADGSWVLVSALEKTDSAAVRPVSGSPKPKEDRTVDVQGDADSYSFAP